MEILGHYDVTVGLMSKLCFSRSSLRSIRACFPVHFSCLWVKLTSCIVVQVKGSRGTQTLAYHFLTRSGIGFGRFGDCSGLYLVRSRV